MMADSRDLNDLALFAWVVEAGGFAAAGRRHGIPKSRLSRRIRALEERLGVRLLQRSTRRFSVTAIGQVFYQHCKAVLLEVDAAHEAVDLGRSEPCGVVRLSCPVTLLHCAVSDLLNRFMARYPQVSIELEADNRRVDVIGDGVDLALRVRFPPLEDSDLVMRQLGHAHQVLVAGPQLLAEAAQPSVPAEVGRLPSLATRTMSGHHQWSLHAADGRQELVPHRPRLVTDDMQSLAQAAIEGLGVVMLPLLMVREHLAAGRLLRVLPDWEGPVGLVHAVFASRRGMLPAVRLLVEHLASLYPKLCSEAEDESA